MNDILNGSCTMGKQQRWTATVYGFGQDEGGVLGETIISSSSSAEELGGHSGDTVLPCLARGHGKHGVENRS